MCCVPNCVKTRVDNLKLHQFPNPVKEPDRFRTWLYSIGGDLLALDIQYIYDSRKVCHSHFEEKYITQGGRLSNIVVPTLQLKGDTEQSVAIEVVSHVQGNAPSVPMQDNINLYNVNLGHSAGPTTSGLPSQRQNKCTKPLNKPFGKLNNPSQAISNGNELPCTPRFCPEASSLAKHVKKLTETKDKFARRLQKAMSLSTNTTFQKVISKFTTMALLFVMMQFREINKKKIGHRFTKPHIILVISRGFARVV